MQQPPVLFVFSKYHSTTHAAYLMFINTLMCIQWRLAQAGGGGTTIDQLKATVSAKFSRDSQSGNVHFVI